MLFVVRCFETRKRIGELGETMMFLIEFGLSILNLLPLCYTLFV